MSDNPLVKASNRTRLPVARGSGSAQDQTFNKYLADFDPRGQSKESGAMRFALACSNDRRFRSFLNQLYERRCKGWSLAAIARSCDISLAEFVQFRRQAQEEWALRMAYEAMPALVENLGVDALSRDVVCERCDAFGWLYVDAGLPNELLPKGTRTVTVKVSKEDGKGNKYFDEEVRKVRTCPPCKGTGWVKEAGDRDQACEKLLDMTGNTGRNKNALVQIVQNYGGMGINSQQDQLSHITFDVDLTEEVIDVESESSKSE